MILHAGRLFRVLLQKPDKSLGHEDAVVVVAVSVDPGLVDFFGNYGASSEVQNFLHDFCGKFRVALDGDDAAGDEEAVVGAFLGGGQQGGAGGDAVDLVAVHLLDFLFLYH